MSESTQLVQNAPQTPNIGFIRIRLILTNFRRQIIRSAHSGLRIFIGFLQNFGNPEIPDFDLPIRSQKNITSLEISVQNFQIMNILHSIEHLNEPIQNQFFGKFLFSLFTLIDVFLEIAFRTILHNNNKIAILYKGVFIFDYIYVIQTF